MQLALISNLDQKYVIEERLRPKLFTKTCEISTIPSLRVCGGKVIQKFINRPNAIVNRVVIRPAGLGNRSRSGTTARSVGSDSAPGGQGPWQTSMSLKTIDSQRPET
jgi:hypothetical protein